MGWDVMAHWGEGGLVPKGSSPLVVGGGSGKESLSFGALLLMRPRRRPSGTAGEREDGKGGAVQERRRGRGDGPLPLVVRLLPPAVSICPPARLPARFDGPRRCPPGAAGEGRGGDRGRHGRRETDGQAGRWERHGKGGDGGAKRGLVAACCPSSPFAAATTLPRIRPPACLPASCCGRGGDGVKWSGARACRAFCRSPRPLLCPASCVSPTDCPPAPSAMPVRQGRRRARPPRDGRGRLVVVRRGSPLVPRLLPRGRPPARLRRRLFSGHNRGMTTCDGHDDFGVLGDAFWRIS